MTPITFSTPKPTYRGSLSLMARGISDFSRCLARTIRGAYNWLRPRWREAAIIILTATSVTCCAGWQLTAQRLDSTENAVRHAIDSCSALIPIDSQFVRGGHNYAE